MALRWWRNLGHTPLRSYGKTKCQSHEIIATNPKIYKFKDVQQTDIDNLISTLDGFASARGNSDSVDANPSVN